MTTLTLPLLAAFLLFAQDTPPMSHQLAQIIMDNAGVVGVACGAAFALIVRTFAKRIANKLVNAARIEAAEANRKAEEIKNATELEKQETQTKIELLRLEIEKNRIEATTLETAQRTNQDLLALLERQTALQEQSQIDQRKNTDTLSDFGKVLSSNSSVLVGNVEELGELREVVQAHDASSSEQLEQVKTAVNGLITSVDKNHQDIMAAIAVLSDAVEACKRKAGDTGEVVVIPLDADEPPEQKTA